MLRKSHFSLKMADIERNISHIVDDYKINGIRSKTLIRGLECFEFS